MSSKLYQSVIQQLKDTTDRVVGILDETGTVAVCSDPSLIGKSMGNSLSDIMGMNDTVFSDGYTYRVIGSRIKMDNVVFVKGTDALAENIAGVLSVSLNTMKDFYDEKYDKSNFIKNVMLENILPGDIYAKSKELHFSGDVPRVVLLVRLIDRTEVFAYDIVQSLFPDKTKDIVINIRENEIAHDTEHKTKNKKNKPKKNTRKKIKTL